MRALLLSVSVMAVVVVSSSCNQHGNGGETVTTDSITGWYGEKFDTNGYKDVKDLPALFAQNGNATYVVSGKMNECCQKKGCWMTLDMGEQSPMRVTFRDYGFFMPLNSAGRTLIMSGIAMNDTTSVEVLRHYAEDAGKSKEEIEAITEPEIELVFEATGVYIR